MCLKIIDLEIFMMLVQVRIVEIIVYCLCGLLLLVSTLQNLLTSFIGLGIYTA